MIQNQVNIINLFILKDKLEWVINERALAIGNGEHPKHYLMNYHKFFVDRIKNFDISKIGPEIENHEMFPERCNVTIAQVMNKNLIKVKVWERGAGLTKACGTAACATAFAGKINNLTDNNTDIEFETGKLSIFIDEKNSIHMKGPVSDIREISIKL